MTISRSSPQLLLRLGLLAALTLGGSTAVAGCAAAADESALGARKLPTDERARQARVELATHDIAAARDLYGEILADTDGSGHAAAGRAVTRLMLLPGSRAVGDLLIEDLGAEDRLDAVSAIWAEEGYLFWLSQGARWEDEGQFAGIKKLIGDRLPWTHQRLDSLAAFVDGLDNPVGASRERLVAVAERLRAIEDDVATALDHGDFPPLVLPGETFHDKRLTVVLGPSEIGLVGATAAALRGGIHLILAYRHDWTLQQAFGDHWQMEAESADAERSNWKAWDFTINYLDGQLFRGFHDSSGKRLESAREAFVRGLGFASSAIEYGLDNPRAGSLEWPRIDDRYARKLRDLAEALQSALEGRTQLPLTEPTVSADLSVFFEDGRALPQDIRWLNWEEVEISSDGSDDMNDGTGGMGGKGDAKNVVIRWTLRNEAIQRIFVDGVFEPGFAVDGPDAPTFDFAGEPTERFLDGLFGRLRASFEDAYLARQ